MSARASAAVPGSACEARPSPEPRPFVSVIVPCRNERDFIDDCLASILATTYPAERLEILVVDGQSDDGTRAQVAAVAAADPRVRLLDNPARITPAALNIGIIWARGEVIVRMDAHNHYGPDYIPELVAALERTGADNVGGVWRTRPGGPGATAQAIAAALSHPFGVGNAHYRTGATEPTWVDTVPFGCYRSEVFGRIGLFDEELVRNQDDEFNARLIRRGGRILLVPSVVSEYFARPTLRKLARMYYQYGYFKPLAIRKLGTIPTVRQLVPALFLSVLAASALLAPWWRAAAIVLVLVSVAYTALLAEATGAALRRIGAPALLLCAVFPTIHGAYGLGFLRGVLGITARRGASPARSAAIPLSR